MAVFKRDGVGKVLIGKGKVAMPFFDANTASRTSIGKKGDTAVWAIRTVDTAGTIGRLRGVSVGRTG